MTDQIHSPYDIPHQPLTDLVAHWSEAQVRTFLATSTGEVDPEDLFLELLYGARIAQEATCSRWCVIATLLRSGAVANWGRIGTATGMAETDVRDGFHAWIAGQRDLRRRTGTIGITDTEASELIALAKAVSR
jgi:hypothetical protein